MRCPHRHFGSPDNAGQTLSQDLTTQLSQLKTLDRRAALIVVDVQIGFNDPTWGTRNNQQAEACIALLLETWRKAAATVVHVHHRSADPSGSFQPGTRGSEPKPQAIPLYGELVYYKQVNSAFIGTTLEADLRKLGIQTLVIVGLTTNHCVSTTVRMAGNLGFNTFVVADATAAFDRAGADGRVRPATEVHNAALGDLHLEFAEVVDTSSVIAALTQEEPAFVTSPARSDSSRDRECATDFNSRSPSDRSV
jgi:nicotinamidase-related amidase